MSNTLATIGLSVLLSGVVAGGMVLVGNHKGTDDSLSLTASTSDADDTQLRAEIKKLADKIDDINTQKGNGRPDRAVKNDIDALRKDVEALKSALKDRPADRSLEDVTEKSSTTDSAAKLTGSESDFRRMLEKIEEARAEERRIQREAEQIARRAEQRTQFVDRLSKGLTELVTTGTIAAADQGRVAEILTSRYDRQLELWNPQGIDWANVSNEERRTLMQEGREKREAIITESDAALKSILNDEQLKAVTDSYSSATGQGGFGGGFGGANTRRGGENPVPARGGDGNNGGGERRRGRGN